MELLLIANFLLFLVLIWSYRAYIAAEKQFEVRATTFQTSFVEMAAVLETVTANQGLLHERQDKIEDHLTVIEVILGVHAEALNTKQLLELLNKKDDVNGIETA